MKVQHSDSEMYKSLEYKKIIILVLQNTVLVYYLWGLNVRTILQVCVDVLLGYTCKHIRLLMSSLIVDILFCLSPLKLHTYD